MFEKGYVFTSLKIVFGKYYNVMMIPE